MTEFRTNCTLPPDIVNYVTPPNTRGTVDILLSCLATILLCTWSIQHPNVPVYLKTRGWKDQLAKALKQVKVMIFTIIAPELLLLLAFGDLSCAMDLTAQIGSVAEKDDVEWSLVHSFFTNMGGFEISFSGDTPEAPEAPVPQPKPTTPENSSTASTEESQNQRKTYEAH